MPNLPSQEELRRLFGYDSATGRLFHLSSGRAAERMWKNDGGYLRVAVGGIHYYAHRIIWKWVTGCDPDEVDHVNSNPGDNRWGNLREANRSENCWNARLRSDNSSGVKGLWWDAARKRWACQVQVNGRVAFSGRFATIEEAKKAVQQARARLHKEFAKD